MTLTDLIYHLVWDVVPFAALLCVVVGAALLWIRTKRTSAMLQMVASVLLFLGMALDRVRWQFVTPYDNSAFADVLRSESMRIVMLLAPLLGLTVFSISYLWYARAQKRI
jgi:TRAP-type mannitol/chloroaromatic compound transport system permease large subunit